VDEYTFKKVPYSPDLSYKLQFDIEVVRSDWAGEIPFGLGDYRLTWDAGSINGALGWGVIYSNGDEGYGALAWYASDTERGRVSPGEYGFIYHDPSNPDIGVGLGVVFRNTLIYDRSTQSLMWEVERLSDGKVMVNDWKTDVGIFTGIDRLFSGSVGVQYGGGTGEAWIDNVALYAVPEPGSILLLAFGASIVRRRRAR